MEKGKFMTEYSADAGSCVINGIGFENRVGDGEYGVYYVKEPTEMFEPIDMVWIDLRNGYGVDIHTYDCAKKGDKKYPIKHFDKEFFEGADALVVYADGSGNIFLVKYF